MYVVCTALSLCPAGEQATIWAFNYFFYNKVCVLCVHTVVCLFKSRICGCVGSVGMPVQPRLHTATGLDRRREG